MQQFSTERGEGVMSKKALIFLATGPHLKVISGYLKREIQIK